MSVADLCREHGMSQSAFYKWRFKYACMDSSMLNGLKRLHKKNARLKKLYAEERLVSEAIKELLKEKSWLIRTCNEQNSRRNDY
ncbi:transposase [Oligella urethralis]|uniref:transposase n=1 Tax=Oligella TaxID=90243 RepID=UPI0009F4013A|nr:Transposase [Oligella urethralis]